MPDLAVIVPSRGRPDAAADLAETFAATCTADTVLVFAVDADDPDHSAYETVIKAAQDRGQTVGWLTCGDGTTRGTMVIALNGAAQWLVKPQNANPPFAVGFLGDDHRPRTVGWDAAYVAALRELGTGIVYGDDLLQGERLPTQCAMTADIIRTLGFMAPTGLRHMYVDNFWLDLGRAASCVRYLPDVVVEHMHPVAGKAEWTEGHQRVNDQAVYTADAAAYDAYRRNAFTADVARVGALRPTIGELPDLAEAGQQLLADMRVRMAAADEAEAAAAAAMPHEWQLFEAGTVPEYTRPDWYAGRDHAPHLEQQGHRERLMATASLVAKTAFSRGLSTLVDLGAGDGGLLSLLGPAITAWGYDLQPTNLQVAKQRGVDVRYGDVVDGDIEWGEIAVCTEMLEHLVDPHAFVRHIARNARVLVCSSPWQERPGSAYEFHTFAWDTDGYRALVEQAGLTVIRQQYCGPFQIIAAVRAS